MRVAALQKEGVIVEERKLPQIAEDEVLLKVAACGLCGTDILKVGKKGNVPGIVLGHEVAGSVVQVGSKVTNLKIGDRVVVGHHVPCERCHFCRHGDFSMCLQFRETQLDPGGFAEYLRIPQKHVEKTTLKIPDSLSFEEASFTEPIACCLRAIQRSQLLPGDSVLIIGLGSIGLILTELFILLKREVWVSDLVEERVRLAQKYGAQRFDASGPGKSPEKFQGRGVDMVLLTAGNELVLKQAFSWVRDGGKIHLFASLSGEGEMKLDLNQIYHRELEILATYSSSPADLAEALRLLAEKKIEVSSLVSLRASLHEIPKAIELTLSKKILKAIITP